ncbi:MAG: HEAT repeat domain-containing protein [Mojavia pulchra JT2-VF2]|jgi:HEAT repeat protein|uniref:HEAT repeat domain-containing protein n=1 Tax=Mojavia pulchra JT2-VF2 TaxID=287848 RepID=A0A951UE49_9NOST|nr:HEAT repeat domain-containing protein [Mojavia pulchra JT2-VF2]
MKWKAASAFALGKIGNSQAVDALISALNHSNSDVRGYAAFALGKIGNSQAVDALISALNDLDSHVRSYAAQALGKIGNQEILAKVIQNPEIDIYEPDIFSLARMLAVRFSKQKLPFIPVYPETIKYSPITAYSNRLFTFIQHTLSNYSSFDIREIL